jgi:hypothetical protein
MILRSVMKHVRDQNWFAVFLDFLIVVVGVFIGIQVANWNEARNNLSIAAGHLSEIAEDLQTHLDFHDELYGAAVARIAAVDYLHEQAFGETLPDRLVLSTIEWDVPETEPPSADELGRIMGSVNLIRITVGSRNGYESLINSGNLGLIRDQELARSIQQYYGQYDDLLDTGVVFRTFRNDGAAIYHANGISVFDERPVEEIIERTRSNPAFAAYLRSTREWAVVHAGFLEDLRIESEALLARIETELERSR